MFGYGFGYQQQISLDQFISILSKAITTYAENKKIGTSDARNNQQLDQESKLYQQYLTKKQTCCFGFFYRRRSFENAVILLQALQQLKGSSEAALESGIKVAEQAFNNFIKGKGSFSSTSLKRLVVNGLGDLITGDPNKNDLLVAQVTNQFQSALKPLRDELHSYKNSDAWSESRDPEDLENDSIVGDRNFDRQARVRLIPGLGRGRGFSSGSCEMT